MREKAKSADIQREVDQSEGKGSLESGGHLQQLDDFFDSDEPFEADNTFAFIVEKMFVRTDEEMEALEKAIDESTTRDERQQACWRLELARLRDDALEDARTNRSKPSTYRELAFNEFKFRKDRAEQLESQGVSIDEVKRQHPSLLIRPREFPGDPGRSYAISTRLAFHFLRTRSSATYRNFIEWYCNRAIDGGIVIPQSTMKFLDETKELPRVELNFDVVDEYLGDNDPSKFEVGQVSTNGVTINSQIYKGETLKRIYSRAKRALGI